MTKLGESLRSFIYVDHAVEWNGFSMETYAIFESIPTINVPPNEISPPLIKGSYKTWCPSIMQPTHHTYG